MHLNTLGGRSFCDLSQYPVFPWIIADYSSKKLNFGCPATFRDLSRPVGALAYERLSEFRSRFDTFVDPTIPKFLYGHHYSTAIGTVVHYLIRLFPFADLHVQYQVRRTWVMAVFADLTLRWASSGRPLRRC
jgi:Beige/BEACH domain